MVLEFDFTSIPGYEGLYMVNRQGQIKSLAREVIRNKSGMKKIPERILKEGARGRYRFVILCKDKVQTKCSIHRLVAITFLPNTDNKPCVNHIDGNPSNNQVDNLEWCTYSENEIHSYTVLGKKINRPKRKVGLKNPKSKPTAIYNMANELLFVFPSTGVAGRSLNISPECIAQVCNGRRRNYKKKFICKYISHDEYQSKSIAS